jgi:oligosaccharyltransferase complex subunit gamma
MRNFTVLLCTVVFTFFIAIHAKRSSAKKMPDAMNLEDDDINIVRKPNTKANNAPVTNNNNNNNKRSHVKSKQQTTESNIARLNEVIEKLPYTYLTDKNFSRYIVDRPRDYHAVVMFTATSPEYQCNVCILARDGFLEGVTAYTDQNDISHNIEETYSDDTDRLEAASKRLAFFILEAKNSRKIFNDMGLESVPRVYALPPTTSSSPKMRMQDFEINIKDIVTGPKVFLQAVSNITGVQIDMRSHPGPTLLLLSIFAYLLALLITNAVAEPEKALFWYRAPAVWGTVTAICFCVGVSGSIFCVIRSPPWYGPGRGGDIQVFAGQGREQFVLEGFVIAGITMMLSLVLVGTKKAAQLPIPGAIRHALVIACVAIFIAIGIELTQTYQFKTPWYSIKDTLPPSLWEWLKDPVRKNSSLLKRIYRSSEFFLNEFKDWDSFGKKVRTLLVDPFFRSAS